MFRKLAKGYESMDLQYISKKVIGNGWVDVPLQAIF